MTPYQSHAGKQVAGRFIFALSALFATSLVAEPLPLTPDQVIISGKSTVSINDNRIHLVIDKPNDESGFRLIGPGENRVFDFSRWKILAVDVQNLSNDRQMRLQMRLKVDSNDKKHRESLVGIALNPGEKRTMEMLLPHRWKYGPPQNIPGVRSLDTAHIQEIDFYMSWPFEKSSPGLVDCELSNFRTLEALVPSQPPDEKSYIPFIDEYGQYIHDDWPTKIHSAQDLKRLHEKELAELDKSSRPSDWDKFGGWVNGPTLEATGNFRVEKYKGKWWFVTPEGHLFFSHGIDVVSRYNDPLKVLPGHEDWFKSLPDGVKGYQPTERVLQEKYGGEGYADAYYHNVTRRMEHWGINTYGDWTNAQVLIRGETPYTLQLTDYDGHLPKLKGSKLKMYDVFDPAYEAKMKNLIPNLAIDGSIVKKSLTDPMCIGYFIDNELNFGNRKPLDYVQAVLLSPANQAAKIEFVRRLKSRYGEIENLNAKWRTQFGSWNDLLKAKHLPDGEKYAEDGKEFFEIAVDRYFKLARDAVKSIAPYRLYLGCRFIGTDSVRPILYKKSKEYCDVLSTNIYSYSVANYPVLDFPDMPVLIGEFHFGLLQRGMFNHSLCGAGVTPHDRYMDYIRFLQGALVHPNIVGTHWFQYRDQPLTGRGDGEAYQLGFVDVTDIPYPEMTHAARLVGENMYPYRLGGQLVPFPSEDQASGIIAGDEASPSSKPAALDPAN